MNKSVWLRAAEIVDSGRGGCCNAIELARYGRISHLDPIAPENYRFRYVFREVNAAYWWPLTAKGRTARVIALLLMDEMERNP